MRSRYDGTASVARMAITAMTASISIIVKARCRVAIGARVATYAWNDPS